MRAGYGADGLGVRDIFCDLIVLISVLGFVPGEEFARGWRKCREGQFPHWCLTLGVSRARLWASAARR